MPGRVLLLMIAVAMGATPALSADADPAKKKRDADRPVPSWFLATPSEAVTSLDKDKGPAQARKPKRVRYTIPAPTRM